MQSLEGRRGWWRSRAPRKPMSCTAVSDDPSVSCTAVSDDPLLFRRTGPGPGTLLLREVLGAVWCPRSAHAPGWTHAATPPPLCQHDVQLYRDVEVSLLGVWGAWLAYSVWLLFSLFTKATLGTTHSLSCQHDGRLCFLSLTKSSDCGSKGRGRLFAHTGLCLQGFLARDILLVTCLVAAIKHPDRSSLGEKAWFWFLI